MSVLFKDKLTGLWRRAAAQFIHSPVPVGTVSAYGGDTAPAGYMLCHGQVLNISDYPDLYDVIGTAYGDGDGSGTTFSIPDLQNKTTFGIGSAVGGLSRLGDKTVGSLPNITGTFEPRGDTGGASCGILAAYGAFYPYSNEAVRTNGSKTMTAYASVYLDDSTEIQTDDPTEPDA